MLWMVTPFCPAGARFKMNCYRHEAFLVVHQTAAVCNFRKIRDGVTQGDPLSMVLYILALLPIYEAL